MSSPDPTSRLPRRARRARGGRRVRRARSRRARRALVAVAVVGSLAAGGVALVRSPLFEVDGIEIAGTRMLDRDEVLRRSGLRIGMNVLSVDAGRVERRLEALPLVADAVVARVYPSKVRIRISERAGAAVARLPGGMWLVEAGGRLIARVDAAPAGLPEVRVSAAFGSQALTEALRLWSALPGWARAKTSDLEAPEPSLISAKIGGTKIVFGSSEDVLAKMQAVVAIFERAKADGRRVVRIDVRAPRRPAAVFA